VRGDGGARVPDARRTSFAPAPAPARTDRVASVCNDQPESRVANDADLKEAQSFIAEHVTSAEQLEVLLLLQANRDRDFTAAEVSQRVYTVPAAATLRLEELVAAGLLRSDRAADPRYRYAPQSARQAERVDALARAYRADRVGVIRFIFAKPVDPLRSFADAFRLKKPGE
jgi:hypothetical protein